MPNVRGRERQLMLSLFKKEATYDAGVTMNGTNAVQMHGFDSDPADWSDDVADDGEEISGSEFPLVNQIIRQRVEIPYDEPRVRPNSLAGLAALAFGSISTTQDPGQTAYRHAITPIAVGTPLPSIQAEEKRGQQYAYKGVIAKSLKLSGKEDGFIALSCPLVGSGTRATSATAFVNRVTEDWILTTQMKVWLETGADISISATPAQGVEDISTATPDDLKVRIRSFDFEWDNDPFLNFGYGSVVLQEADKGARRRAMFNFSVLYKDETELNYYLNQVNAAIELDAKSATLVDPEGTYYWGMDLIIPAARIRKVGTSGRSGDFLTQDFEALVINDGVNPVVKLYVYNAQPLYLAA